jgi:solute carrier family 35 protein F1/2
VADVEANYLLVKAYQYTDLCSVTVLDAFTVPTVMALSATFLHVRYSARQCGAAVLCVAGIVALFASDLIRTDASFPQAWLGDVLVLAGAALYGVSNVAQEHLLRQRLDDRVEYLAHLGAYGAAIALIQSAVLEREALSAAWAGAGGSASGAWERLGLGAAFVLALTCFYVGVAFLLERGSSATTMNLSLLTSDFWSVAAGLTLLQASPGIVYALAFALVVIGLALYHWDGGGASPRLLETPPPLTPPHEPTADADDDRRSRTSEFC